MATVPCLPRWYHGLDLPSLLLGETTLDASLLGCISLVDVHLSAGDVLPFLSSVYLLGPSFPPAGGQAWQSSPPFVAAIRNSRSSAADPS